MKGWVQLEGAWVRLRDVSAFEIVGDARLKVYLRSGLTLSFDAAAERDLREATGIAAAERAEHGVYG